MRFHLSHNFQSLNVDQPNAMRFYRSRAFTSKLIVATSRAELRRQVLFIVDKLNCVRFKLFLTFVILIPLFLLFFRWFYIFETTLVSFWLVRVLCVVGKWSVRLLQELWPCKSLFRRERVVAVNLRSLLWRVAHRGSGRFFRFCALYDIGQGAVRLHQRVVGLVTLLRREFEPVVRIHIWDRPVPDVGIGTTWWLELVAET